MKRRKIVITSIAILAASAMTLSAFAESNKKSSAESHTEGNPSQTQYQTKREREPQVYGIGSVSKMFATVAVMQLAEQGKLDLDAPLTNYIPEFKMADERYKQITARMLLNHTSGILGGTMSNSFLYGEFPEAYKENVLKSLQTQRLKADPGEFSVYCNDGFTLAEVLVEHVTGMSFSEYVKTSINEPMGMKDTMSTAYQFDESNRAKTYIGGMETEFEGTGPIASGGLYATATDLCRFSKIFMKGANEVLSSTSVEEMAKPWYLQDKICVEEGDSIMNYGLGWDSVDTYPFNQYGIKALAKGGDTTTYHANLTVLPEYNMSAAVVASGGGGVYCELLAQEILLEALKEEGLIEDIKEEKAFDKKEKVAIPESIKQFAGQYRGNSMLEVTFTDEDTMLLASIDQEYPTVQEYIYTAEGKFVPTKGDYISALGTLVSAENGTKGTSSIHFKEEVNGETYILGSTYESMPGVGTTAFTLPMAQKAKANPLTDEVAKAWEVRNGKKYYRLNEKYNSSQQLKPAYHTIELLEEVPGYTKKDGEYASTRIVDANFSTNDIQIPGMSGRDIKDYRFYKKGAIEYLNVIEAVYISEEGIHSSKEMMGQCQISEQGTEWYKIEKEDEGKEIHIEVPSRAAYYVYDDEGNYIDSSLFHKDQTKVILPKEGSIAFVGDEGATFVVKEVENK